MLKHDLMHYSSLRYIDGTGRNHLSSSMILEKLNLLHDEDSPDLRQIVKYAKALTSATQHRMKHGESAALLDLMPWGNVLCVRAHTRVSCLNTHSIMSTHQVIVMKNALFRITWTQRRSRKKGRRDVSAPLLLICCFAPTAPM